MPDDFGWMDATAQAELVRRREVRPGELVEAAVARIERLNHALNAVTIPLFERARAAAASHGLPDGPFRGVPFLLKDGGACQVGLPRYLGNRALRDVGWRCPADTPLGARYRAAGFVVLGCTNTPEFGWQNTTQPLAFGPTRNPWDLTRSPSGSSGGAAAAVAAGLVAVAAGGDYGGSIRTPASWCGVVGLKPSRGRTTRGVTTDRNGVEHVLTRSVRDTAAALDAIAGPAPGDLYAAPPPRRPYAQEVGAEPGRLRIGVVTQVEATGIEVHPACAAAVEATARLLESLGHVVEPAGPASLCDDAFIEHRRILGACRLRATLARVSAILGRPLARGDVEPYTWALAEEGASIAVTDYLEAEEWQQAYAARIAGWWAEGRDLLLTPATGEPPAPLEALRVPEDEPLAAWTRLWRVACFAPPFNATGQPAISLPLAWTGEGLPVGVQLVADMGREDLLIRVAAQLEQARPWGHRHPPTGPSGGQPSLQGGDRRGVPPHASASRY